MDIHPMEQGGKSHRKSHAVWTSMCQ
jgi:hypothetical protein